MPRAPRLPAIVLLSALAVLPGHARPWAQDELVVAGGALVLSPGPVAELLGRISDRDAQALRSPWPSWQDRSAAGWGGEAAWRRWVELVREESPPHEPHPGRRAELAMLALLQGRDADAWSHLLDCAGEPRLVAGLLPLFCPGVPAEGAPSADVADGALLRPALPPPSEPRGGLRWLVGRRIERRSFRIGAARCSLAVSVDRDGLEVRLVHLEGEAARVRVLAPLPAGVEPGSLFVDWMRRPPSAEPVEFALDAEHPEHSLWVGFLPRRERWPNPPPQVLSGACLEREIRVESESGTEPLLARFAEALGELLGVPASFHARADPRPPGLEPLVLSFDAGPLGERKLCELFGQAEAFALSAPLR